MIVNTDTDRIFAHIMVFSEVTQYLHIKANRVKTATPVAFLDLKSL